ncbi:hypothetical protein [Streptomyces sp. Ru71]|uniref:hypothetical protein n=1 Tax=Streptomyces sp. Ru71 TaxID=2080746 RepID=UPI0011B02AD3|nr:hypothetical protein [Streptomyces sp. Ru71]
MTMTEVGRARERFCVLKRAFTVAGLVVAAAVTPLVTAAPASASIAQCTDILNNYGYRVGAKVTNACSWPAVTLYGQRQPNPNCITPLVGLGVKYSHAKTACEWA